MFVLGNINLLGDMYAFGLLGAFTLTCLGLDIVRVRDRKAERQHNAMHTHSDMHTHKGREITVELKALNTATIQKSPNRLQERLQGLWRSVDFWLGVLTTGLVMVAWITNLIAKPLATEFGGTVTVIGMIVAYVHYRKQQQKGQAPVHIVPLSNVELMTNATLAVLFPSEDKANTTVIHAAINNNDRKPLAFLYIGQPQKIAPPQPFEVYDPYLSDEYALNTFRKAENYVREEKPSVSPLFLYRSLQQPSKQQEAQIVQYIWRTMHPHELLIAAENVEMLEDINPDRIRYELTPQGRVAHLMASKR